MNFGEIQELTDTTPEELTEDDLMKMSASRKQTEIRQSGRKILTTQVCFFSFFLSFLKMASFVFFSDMDPSDMGTDTKGNGRIVPYKNIFRVMQKEKSDRNHEVFPQDYTKCECLSCLSFYLFYP